MAFELREYADHVVSLSMQIIHGYLQGLYTGFDHVQQPCFTLLW
jgi:hypothetical protein